MKSSLKLSIIGCGDFLRWQLPAIQAAKNMRVLHCYDPIRERAVSFAEKLSAEVADDADVIWNSGEVDAVALFVPPWLRLETFEKAFASGKSVITTKPLAPNVLQCDRMLELVSKGLKVGIIYNRTESAFVEALKSVLDSGEYGKLALLKQDWIHHYPTWNKWALDPERNGGPFMDAMIHNLNITRYLMGRPVTQSRMFSEKLSHPDLSCSDTDFMKLDFAENGSAHLFITWAADLAVFSNDGNDREHIDQWFAVTDKGWMIKQSWQNDKPVIVMKKDQQEVKLQCPDLDISHYDLFADYAMGKSELPARLVTVEEAAEDIRLIREAEML